MKLSAGKILKPGGRTERLVAVELGRRPVGPRRVERAVVDASKRAEEIVARAEEKAQALLEEAKDRAEQVKLNASVEARAEALAELATQSLALKRAEQFADEAALTRSIQLAGVLAERLLGEELQLRPERVTALARQALAESRGARRIKIYANPRDLSFLEAERESLGLGEQIVELFAEPHLGQGELRLETDLGVLDAALRPQLERLVQELKRSLK